MIKRITLPVLTITPGYIAQKAEWDDETKNALNKRNIAFQEQINQAEAELDDALNDGFQYVTQYEAKSSSHESIVFVLHKKPVISGADHAPEGKIDAGHHPTE